MDQVIYLNSKNIPGLLHFITEIQRFTFYQLEQRPKVLIKRRIILQNNITRLLAHEVAHLSLLELSQMTVTCDLSIY